MYLLDSSAIITPFHRAQLRALSVALGHNSLKYTQTWLEGWFRKGFSSRDLIISQEVYGEIVNEKKRHRPEYRLLKELRQSESIKMLEPKDATWKELANIHKFVTQNYEPHQAQKFLEKNDPMLIALAKTYEVTLVAEERHFIPEVNGASSLIKGEPRLPYVAWVFGVRCISLLTLLREVTF